MYGNGNGKAKLGFWITVIRQGILLIPLLLILPLFLRIDGVLNAGAVSDGIAGLTALSIRLREVRRLDSMQKELLSESQPSDQPGQPETLQDMDALFLHMQQVVSQHSYYFLYHAQLSQLSPNN